MWYYFVGQITSTIENYHNFFWQLFADFYALCVKPVPHFRANPSFSAFGNSQFTRQICPTSLHTVYTDTPSTRLTRDPRPTPWFMHRRVVACASRPRTGRPARRTRKGGIRKRFFFGGEREGIDFAINAAPPKGEAINLQRRGQVFLINSLISAAIGTEERNPTDGGGGDKSECCRYGATFINFDNRFRKKETWGLKNIYIHSDVSYDHCFKVCLGQVFKVQNFPLKSHNNTIKQLIFWSSGIICS